MIFGNANSVVEFANSFNLPSKCDCYLPRMKGRYRATENGDTVMHISRELADCSVRARLKAMPYCRAEALIFGRISRHRRNVVLNRVCIHRVEP